MPGKNRHKACEREQIAQSFCLNRHPVRLDEVLVAGHARHETHTRNTVTDQCQPPSLVGPTVRMSGSTVRKNFGFGRNILASQKTRLLKPSTRWGMPFPPFERNWVCQKRNDRNRNASKIMR